MSGAGVQTIRADLSFHVACDDPDAAIIDEKAEAFFRQRGFVVLNKAEAARKLQQPVLLPRDTLAIDAQSREATLIQIPFGNRSISMSLRTPPPTRRNEALEADLLSLADSTLGCRVHQVTRGKNGPERRRFHDDLIKTDMRLFRKFGGR